MKWIDVIEGPEPVVVHAWHEAAFIGTEVEPRIEARVGTAESSARGTRGFPLVSKTSDYMMLGQGGKRRAASKLVACDN